MAQITIGNWTYHQIQINRERTTTNLSFKTVLKMDQNQVEVFINRIPYNMYEDDLIPLFETVGVVIQFRLMMDFSGRNRGFGYVTFLDSNDGHRAIAQLNNILVSSWCRLQLSVSKNIRRLWMWDIIGALDYETVVDMIVEKVDPEEVFINRIPYNMYEDDLIPLFETVGVVIQFRLMMDFSGRNRGFGYVTFLDSNDGHRAIAQLNNILVSSWCRLQLSVSKNIRRLWMWNISGALDYETVVDMIVEKVDPEEIAIANRNGRICFLIKFNTHREAALSRKVLIREIFDFRPNARANWDNQES